MSKPCGCKNKKLKPADENDSILIDEKMLLNINNTVNTKSQHDSCKIYSNDYINEYVNFKLFDVNGVLLHETTVLKLDPCETFVDIIHNFEKKSNYIFPNKQSMAAQISAHTYVHKEVNDALYLYNNNTIDLNTFQARIQQASEITYENSSGLRMEFEKIKSLFNKLQ